MTATVFDKIVAFNKETTEALVKSSTAAYKGFEELSKATQDVLTKTVSSNDAAIKALLAVKSPTELADLQSRLLARAAGWLAPGGQLVYAVCSLEPSEGEDQAGRIALPIDPIRAEELPAGLIPTGQGWLRTEPGMLAPVGGLDGFFIARWRQG